MDKESKVISKTVRFDKELVEKILELVETRFEGWRKPDFSDLSRYGLCLVLAAFGIEYEKPSLREADYHSARRTSEVPELEELIAELYIEAKEKEDRNETNS
jgi:hypothetical protein